jgi:acetylornithine/N-succinyldiaminopimelate aminotransferase
MAINQQLVSRAQEALMGVYKPAPIVLSEGRGCRVKDVEGREYLDMCAGVAVISVGHSHPAMVAAISGQAARLMHVSNLFYNERAIELATELGKRTPFDRFFFCNSGTEANEAMIKLARRHHFQRGDRERSELVSTVGSFHGRSMGSLTLTGEPKYQEGVGPLMGGVCHVPYDDPAALRAAVNERTAAVVLEPIQGEGGIVVPGDRYLAEARSICDRAGALLLFDEVQTGFGRTGRFLACEHSGVVPDACALAKGIAGGFPLGALAASEKVAPALQPGSHGSTFGGNALGCAAALAVLRIFDQEKLIENAELVGKHLGERLQAMAADPAIPAAAGVRGRGLLRGIVLAETVDPAMTVQKIREAGVLLSLAGGNVLRFSPPLCVSQTEIDEAADRVIPVLRDAPGKSPS